MQIKDKDDAGFKKKLNTVSFSRNLYSSGKIGFFISSSNTFTRAASPALLVEGQASLQVANTVGAFQRLSATVSQSPKFERPPQKQQHAVFGFHHLKTTLCCGNTNFLVAYCQIVLANTSERVLSFACHLYLVED